VLLSEQAHTELEDLKKFLKLPGIELQTYEEYLSEEKANPSYVYLW
jgi:hypothetical protein